MQMPEIGATVQIEPAPEHCPAGATRSNVIADPSTGRFLSVKGEEVRWNTHHITRLRAGEIRIVVKPAPVAATVAVKEK
jgi:hypothetical protein